MALAALLGLVAGTIGVWFPNPHMRPDKRYGPGVAWRFMGFFAVFGFACARTGWLLWRRRRVGVFFGASVAVVTVLGNYYGPMKGTQSVSIGLLMLALLGAGWSETQ